MTRAASALALTILLLAACVPAPEPEPAPEPLVIPPSGIGKLQVAPGGRYFQHADGRPFFWLGDHGLAHVQALTREEADDYLEDRRRKGFNVIQAMVLHGADDANAYGAAALVDEDPRPTQDHTRRRLDEGRRVRLLGSRRLGGRKSRRKRTLRRNGGRLGLERPLR
ncbi:MAG: DUF4038 domain-containing protein [Bryobacterales bacterium]